MSTLSAIEVFYVALCGLGFLGLAGGVYVAEARLTTALKNLEKHPNDTEMQARAHIASDGVRSALVKATVMFCFLTMGIAASFLPARPPSAQPASLFATIAPIVLIIAPAVLAVDAYLEWRSSAVLAALIRAMKAEMEAIASFQEGD